MNVRALVAGCGLACVAMSASAQCIMAPEFVNSGDAYDCNPIEVYWSEVPAATEFEVYRAPVSDPENPTLIETTTATRYDDYSADYDIPYLYWVVSIAPCGRSLNSDSMQVTRISGSTGRPSWVQASDSVYCDMIEIDWDVSTWSPFYHIYRSQTDDFDTALWVGETNYPPFQDYGMPANVAQYYWVVGAVDCGEGEPSPSDIGYSLYGIYLNQGPTDLTVPIGGDAVFQVDVSGFPAYEWYHEDQIVYDDGRITGADSNTITISNVTGNDGGWYYCQIYGGCGTITTEWAFLTVVPDNNCVADLTGSSDPNDVAYGIPDGRVDASDFFYYLDAFSAGNTETADLTGSSDPNDPQYGTPDSLLDAADFFYYLDLFVQGC